MAASWSYDLLYQRMFQFLSALSFNGVNVVRLCTVLVLLPFILTYCVTWLAFVVRIQRQRNEKVPPTVPYIVPFFAHTGPFLQDAVAFVCSVTTFRGKFIPVRLTLFKGHVFVVQGVENIVSLWKASHVSTATAVHNFYLKQIFGMPDEALKLYTADDSGCYKEPHPHSNVKPEDRIDHITHRALIRFLAGPGLDPFFNRFTENLIDRLHGLEIGCDWLHMEDLWGLFKSKVTLAAIEAMCGSSIISLVPSIAEDLWSYDAAIPDLVKSLPRWWVPRSYAKRDHILKCIKKWHAFGRAHFDEKQIGPDGDWDPCYGCHFIRSRQETFAKMDGMDSDAVAASDLGAIWATNTNAVPSTFWCTLECFSDPSLLLRVRHEVKKCMYQIDSGKCRFDVEKLGKNPLLQSIYAEVLRLRIAAFIMRSPERDNMKINDWILPRGEVVLVATTPAHMDEEVWNTGQANEHPVNRFWADRFLIYHADPRSGPRKVRTNPVAPRNLEKEDPVFSLDDLSGSWIPFGGGFRACPGRHFAKREILMTFAIMVTMFDIEVDGSRVLQTDPRRGGLGAQRPRYNVPFRIRKRTQHQL